MAQVIDLSGNVSDALFAQGRSADHAISSHNRTNAGTPNGVLTPNFVGEIVYDTTNNEYYYATLSTNVGWTAMSLGVAG